MHFKATTIIYIRYVRQQQHIGRVSLTWIVFFLFPWRKLMLFIKYNS